MATEAEVKAQERRELLNDIRRRRAATAQAEGSVRAADEGQYPGVDPVKKGPFDDEINQAPENKMSLVNFLTNYFTDPKLSATGAGIDLLGRLGATTAPITQKPLETISQGGDNIVQKAGKFLFEDAAKVAAKINSGVSFDELTPGEKFAIASVPAEAIPGLGLAPDVLKLAKNFVVNAGKSTLRVIDDITQPVGVTNEGINMPMTMSDEGVSPYPGGVKSTIINVQDENVAKILEDFRTGNISRIEAGTKLNDLIPKAGILKIDKSKAAGVQVDSKFNNVFDEYLKSNKFEDIYSTDIYRSTGGKNKEFAIAPQRVNAILKAKKIADEDVTDASYYVKFNNALEEFFPRAKTEQTYNSSDNIFFTKASSTVLDESRSVFKYLNEDISKLTKPKSIKVSGLDSWSNLKVNSKEPIKGNAMRYLKSNIVFDESGKTFQNVKKDLLVNNKFVADNIKKTKDLFLDKSKAAVFGLDHIQPPRFGGTNLESNLRIIPQGEHLTLSKLPSSKTTATKSVKAKTGFEDDFFKEGVKIVDLIQKGNYDEAIKIANKLDVMVNDFKSVYKNTDFVVGEPHFAVKSGDKTASFVRYSDQLNLTGEQKKIVNQIFNKTEYSHKPNAGKSIEKQSEDLLNTYEEIALLSGGKIEKEISKQIYRFNNGGMVGISHLTRPLGNF